MDGRRVIAPLGTALLTAVASASGSGLLIREAAAQVSRRSDDEEDSVAPLLLAPAITSAELLAHRSHSSHSSHRSHSSGGGGGGHYSGYTPSPEPAPEPPPAPAPPPPPPKPATVTFVALPGGRISIDGTVMGTDATGSLTLKAGYHSVKIENRFLGEHKIEVKLEEGQTGVVEIDW